MTAPTTCRWCPRLTTRTAGVCYCCERDGNGQTDATYALIDGDWRFDPFKRVRVWVPRPQTTPQNKRVCGQCLTEVGPRQQRCEPCQQYVNRINKAAAQQRLRDRAKAAA